MLRKILICFTTILTSLSFLPNFSSAVTNKIVLGYYIDDPSSAGSFKSNFKYMNQLATDTYTLNSSGNIIGSIPKSMINLANSNHIKTFAVISNFGKTNWDAALAHKILSNTTIRKNLITNLVKLARSEQYKGINIDFEGLLPKDRKLFSSFIQELSKKLSENNYLTMVSVPAKEKDDPSDSWSGAYDYKSLGKSANYIQVMTYDETGPWWNAPGSVASMPWLEASLKYTVKTINPKKVLMGIAAYGNDWNITTGNIEDNRQVPLSEIPQLIKSTGATPVRDKVSGSMYFNYQDQNGLTHEVWYDDSASISQKAHSTIKYRLGGISVYAIGMEGSDFWNSLHKGLK
ncbi:MAG TPA: glycosyl hydrolase family 18 protein [Rummeliibacillus sp.]|nr:glycosyl hydrolase family 18 protein [Rummeliibacillus sp.]